MTGVAVFDDFTDTVLGHHPDFTVGLANAAPAVTAPGDAVLLYCPPEYLHQRSPHPGVAHHPSVGRSPGSGPVKLPYARGVEPDNLAAACLDAQRRGAEVFIDCYFDENYAAWPAPPTTLRFVHSLHRPGYFARQAGEHIGRERLARLLRELDRNDLFVVHSRAGERLAAELVDQRALIRTGWPSATRAEVAAWFDRAATATDDADPYVLSIGSARGDKGFELLVSALATNHRLRIVGQQYEGVEADVRARHPDKRIEWETGWVSRERLGEEIARAAVIVFPYQPEFTDYGGASGALGQALTFGKPVIVSEVLADQVPDSPACRVIPTGDAAALRRAIDEALGDLPALREAAADLRKYVEDHHTYEGHLERILDRCA
jgi:glycosyltransferase involved in cell wall biosynthesis